MPKPEKVYSTLIITFASQNKKKSKRFLVQYFFNLNIFLFFYSVGVFCCAEP